MRRVSEVLRAYPQLSEDDLLSALAYAADVLSHGLVAPQHHL